MTREHLAGSALFLDLDGTLIDIAATPDAVVVPGDLSSLLARIAQDLDDALAILTGRPISHVDQCLSPLAPIAAGAHGAEIRISPGGEVEQRVAPIDSRVIAAVQAWALNEPGTIVEQKPTSIAVHYRAVPS